MAAALVCAPAGAAARAKPDLVVKAFRFESSPPHESASLRHVVLDGDRHGKFGVDYTVKNVGDRRAPASTARVVVSGRKVGDESVGAIPPGGKKTFHQTYDRTFAAPGNNWQAFVCADWGDVINESNEHNNCSPNLSFAVIPRTWDVSEFTAGPQSFTGLAPLDAAHAVGMTFHFYGILNDVNRGEHSFLWLATGGVAGTVSGKDDPCTYKGHGAVSHSPWDIIAPVEGYLEITPDLDSYYADVEDSKYTFTVTQTCTGPFPGGTSTTNLSQLQTIESDGSDPSMAPEATTLAGSYRIPTGYGSGAGIGKWSFKADLP